VPRNAQAEKDDGDNGSKKAKGGKKANPKANILVAKPNLMKKEVAGGKAAAKPKKDAIKKVSGAKVQKKK
jgi:hypothetical protein